MGLRPGEQRLTLEETVRKLREWIGQEVEVTADADARVLVVRGTLTGGEASIEPETEEVMEYEFGFEEFEGTFAFAPWSLGDSEDASTLYKDRDLYLVFGTHMVVSVCLTTKPADKPSGRGSGLRPV